MIAKAAAFQLPQAQIRSSFFGLLFPPPCVNFCANRGIGSSHKGIQAFIYDRLRGVALDFLP